MTGATIAITPTVVGYSPITTISSYVTAAPGASATANLTTTTPTLTYNAAGCYRWNTTCTDANSNTGVGYRWVFVNPTSPVFTLKSCAGDFDSGGWSFEVECLSGATESTIVPGALVALYARDFYGGVEGSIGPVTSYENVICVGWIAAESITWKPDQGSVTFEVRSLDWWLDQENAYPVGLFDNASPSKWTQFPTLTVDDICYHFLNWRSTVTLICDCYFPVDSRRMRYINTPTGTLWAQLKNMSDETIFAKPMVNALGQLYVQVDLNLLASGSRSSIPTVQALTTIDWLEEIDIQRHTTPELGFVELSGVGSYNGTTAAPLFSRAPGTIAKHYGHPEAPGNHLFTNQAECNQIAGALLAEANAEYEIVVKLTNQRLFDIAPHQYATITIAAGDTPRGISMTAQKLVPRRVEYEHDPERGNITATVHLVSETIGVSGITYVPPDPPNPSTPPVVPPIIDIPPIIITPPIISPPVITPPPGDTGACTSPTTDTGSGTFFLNWDRTHLDAAGTELERHAYAWFPMTIRPSSALVQTTFRMNWVGYDSAGANYAIILAHLHVYAIDGSKTRLLTLAPGGDPYVWTMTTVSALPIAGFEVYLDPIGDTDFTGWAAGAFLSIWGPASADSDGDLFTGISAGNYYWVQNAAISGGSWREQGGAYDYHSDIQISADGGTTWVGHIGHSGIGFQNAGSYHSDVVYPMVTHAAHANGFDWNNYVFYYAGGNMRQRVFSSSFGDNADVNGGMLSTLSTATLTGTRYVDLGETSVENPCGTT
jgi:hypothetical protein